MYIAAAGARARSSDRNEQQARCTEGVICALRQYGYRVPGKSCYLEADYILLYTSYFHNVNNCKHRTRALVDINNKKRICIANDSTGNIVSSLTPEGVEK